MPRRQRFPQPSKVDLQLLDAACENDLGAAREAVADGANVNAVNRFGRDALIHAARMQNVELVKLLLSKGADPNQLETDLVGEGLTPLMRAASVGSGEIVDLLLAHGANMLAKLKIDHGVYKDVPDFAVTQAHRDLAIRLRSMANAEKRSRNAGQE